MQAAEIKKCLKEGLEFLTLYSYSYSEFTVSESRASDKFYTLSYISDLYKRKILISFFPKHGFIEASLVDTEDSFNFSDAGSMTFKLTDFENTRVESLDQINLFLQSLQRELKTQYLPLVKGGKFSNDAFDWSPYK